MDFGTVWQGGPIGIPYNVVGSGVPKVYVDFDYSDESDPGPYPIPANPLREYGSDRHILIVDSSTCTLYELFDASLYGSQWYAGSGAIWDLNSNHLRPDTWTSADAAGLPILPGLVRYEEVLSGEINHAIRFTAASTNGHIWPARHRTSDNPSAPQIPPMGARFRLRASYDISGYPAALQVILRAMKTYGIILADNGSNWYVSGAPDPRWDDDMLHELDALTGNDFEAVDVSSLMVDPDSGVTGSTIFGNAGVAGATLSYIDVTAKTVTSVANGDYALNVTNHWSGSVTPSHACFTFDPASQGYSNVTANQINQNFNPIFNPSSGCADITVSIAGANRGRYGLLADASMRTSYMGVDSGPVKIMSTNGKSLIASERINLLDHPAVASYTEFMGLPATQVSDTYLFPWYNNASLDSQLRFANVGTSPTTVTVKIGTVVNQSYPLGVNASMRISYPGVDTGPVEVKSSGGVPIIASERINLFNHPLVESYTEFIGLLGSNTAGTRYLFPWYNNVGLDSQLRFANVGTSPTTVTVKIGAAVNQSYPLAINESKRISYPGVDTGPVEITSSGSVPIIASERVNLLNHPAVSSYSEFLGLPGATITHTKYLFPWYNNVGLDSQLRIANVGTTSTTVTVKIGTLVNQSYPLAANTGLRLTFPVDTGPVTIESSGGVPIIASERVNLLHHPSVASYSEFLGLSVGSPSGWPGNQLSTTYWFPWYNNVGLDSQLRFGFP